MGWVTKMSLYPLQAIDAQTIREVCTKYIYEKHPAVAAVGMLCVSLPSHTPSTPITISLACVMANFL